MATPTYPSKRYYAAGTARGTTWGTAVALGATKGVLITGDAGLTRNQKFEDYPAIDQIMPKDGWLGINEAVELSPPCNLQYELGAWGGWLAAIFGTAGTPVQQAATVAYKHTFQYADSVTHFFTFAHELPGKILEVPSAMPYKLNLKLNGAAIAASIGLRGNTAINDSAVNTLTQMDAITYTDRAHFVHFSHGLFLMNTQAGSGLANPTDYVEISDFDLNLERSIDNVHIAGSTNIALPKEGDIPKNTLKVTLPRASAVNTAYFTNFTGMTAMKASLSFVGPLIASTYYYTITFYFPRLMFVNVPDVKLDGIIKNELLFTVQEAAAAPTGMTYARPYAEVTNLQTTDYLA